MASNVICIDMGTSQMRIWLASKGNIFDEPTAVAIDTRTGKVAEIGYLASKALGRSPYDIKVYRPVQDGVVADVSLCARFISQVFVNLRLHRVLRGSTVLVSAPNQLTAVEKDALVDVIRNLGARRIILESAAKMAALGAGIDMSSPRGVMVLDIGGGISDCAAISLGDVAAARSTKIGGESFDRAIVRFTKNTKNLAIGPATAEQAKMRIGSLDMGSENQFLEVSGRDIVTGLPSSAVLSTAELRPVLLPLAQEIADTTTEVLQDVKPELAADLVKSGILVTGAGALVAGTKEFLENTLKMAVHFASDMPNGVMLGLKKAAEEYI